MGGGWKRVGKGGEDGWRGGKGGENGWRGGKGGEDRVERREGEGGEEGREERMGGGGKRGGKGGENGWGWEERREGRTGLGERFNTHNKDQDKRLMEGTARNKAPQGGHTSRMVQLHLKLFSHFTDAWEMVL